MRFSFGLQTLLNWKRNLEGLSQMRFAEKLRQLRLEEEEIARLARERETCAQALEERCRRAIAASEYLLYKEFSEDHFRVLSLRRERRSNALEEVEGERRTLLNLMKEKKILDRLKERRLKEFMEEMEKKEAKDNDERVVMTYRSPSHADPY